MENTGYGEKDLRTYNAWLKYIIRDELPQYTSNDLPRVTYCREPMKYYEASVRREHKDLLFRLLMQDKENLLSGRMYTRWYFEGFIDKTKIEVFEAGRV